MSSRGRVIRLPNWIAPTLGIVLTAGLAATGAGFVALPSWLLPLRIHNTADVARAADRAEAVWRRAAGEIISEKIAAGVAGVSRAPRYEGLLGEELTPLVTTLGHLEAKQLTVTPAWARIITQQLAGAGIGAGDVVAASFSGSFPGLNLAVAAACEALEIRLIAVSSVTASSWGATEPGFTWPEMESRLVHRRILRPVSIAISAGGDTDRALDLDDEGRRMARDIAVRAARDLQAVLLEPATFHDAVTERLSLFDRRRNGRRLAAYINVGGTEASLGHSTAILRMTNGWIPPVPFDSSAERGVVAHMAERGVRVLHLLNVRDLAMRWGVL
ncbi:MAG: poly-gamma-glutamate system protein [Acidobacteria bacterium]|nr:poly-gamma-glutamate system protein [Acidobacteriota bacterium]